jgi:hypothetical protein
VDDEQVPLGEVESWLGKVFSPEVWHEMDESALRLMNSKVEKERRIQRRIRSKLL